MRFSYQTFVSLPAFGRRLELWLLAAPLALCLSLLIPPVFAAEYSYRTNESGEIVLTLSGPITVADGAAFLVAVNRNNPRIVELEGPGGDMLSAARIGIIIHERRMSTHAIGDCRSACAYIWIAGQQMLADEGVAIDNHLPANFRGGVATSPDAEHLAIFGWYLGKLDLSVEMMGAFLNLATGHGSAPNQYFDMLAFAQYWNAPVEIVPIGLAGEHRLSQFD